MSGDPPLFVWASLAAGVFALGIHGVRALVAVRGAARDGHLDELRDPPQWRLARAFVAAALGLVMAWLARPLGLVAWGAGATAATLAYALAPQVLAAVRDRVERELLDDLPLHLDLMALAMESGATLPSALALAAEHGPEGALRRGLEAVLLDVHVGIDVHESLKALDQRIGLRSVNTWVTSLRTADRLGLPLGPVLRERATQSAANRFARAERLARAAPLKLWATLVLCIAPCTFVVLAFPVAKLLALLVGLGGG